MKGRGEERRKAWPYFGDRRANLFFYYFTFFWGVIFSSQRPTDVPDFGLLNDLLWSDPSEAALEWEDNERGVSYCFGKAVLQDYLAKHDFDLVARAHMVVEDGYEFFSDRTLVTIFSAPNYCGEFDNKG